MTRDRNRTIVRDALYRYVGMLRATGLAETTVTDLLVEFMAMEIVAEWERAGVADRHLVAPFRAKGPDRSTN